MCRLDPIELVSLYSTIPRRQGVDFLRSWRSWPP